MAYSLSRQAEADFNHIYAIGVQQFGEAQGDTYAAGMERVFAFLAEYPRAARERTELSPPARAFPYQAHVIVYDVVGKDIVILRLRHSREGWLEGRP